MSIEKYIKTQCGLEKFNHLRKLADKSLIDKIRLYHFVIIATLRDIFKLRVFFLLHHIIRMDNYYRIMNVIVFVLFGIYILVGIKCGFVSWHCS